MANPKTETDQEKLERLAYEMLTYLSPQSMQALDEQIGKCQNDCTHDGSVKPETWTLIRDLLAKVRDIRLLKEKLDRITGRA